jgi:hypothetical protein
MVKGKLKGQSAIDDKGGKGGKDIITREIRSQYAESIRNAPVYNRPIETIFDPVRLEKFTVHLKKKDEVSFETVKARGAQVLKEQGVLTVVDRLAGGANLSKPSRELVSEISPSAQT